MKHISLYRALCIIAENQNTIEWAVECGEKDYTLFAEGHAIKVSLRCGICDMVLSITAELTEDNVCDYMDDLHRLMGHDYHPVAHPTEEAGLGYIMANAFEKWHTDNEYARNRWELLHSLIMNGELPCSSPTS